jgi:hypothetical protein
MVTPKIGIQNLKMKVGEANRKSVIPFEPIFRQKEDELNGTKEEEEEEEESQESEGTISQ